MLRPRLWLAAPLLAVAVCLDRLFRWFAGGGGSAGASAGSGAGLGRLGEFRSSRGSRRVRLDRGGVRSRSDREGELDPRSAMYTTSKEIAIPAISIADAAYCLYWTATAPEEFSIQVATSDPADAGRTFNDATGDTIVAQSGIGDSAMFAASYPELLVVWGQTTVVVGQDGCGEG